jgi:hypothetical protein
MRNAAQGCFRLSIFWFIALAPSCIVEGWRISPLLGIWAAGAGQRWYWRDRQIRTDCVIFGVTNAWLSRGELRYILVQRWMKLDSTLATGLLFVLATLLALFAYLLRRAYVNKVLPADMPPGALPWTLPYPKAKIFPCEIKHARMYPTRHAFVYSYLQCGFPIVPAVVARDGELYGDDSDARLGRWWLRINAKDYLGRGNGWAGFYTKLKIYLREQVRYISVQYARIFDSSSTWTMPNGRMPTSSQLHASSCMPSTLYRSGTSTTQITSSSR